MHDVDLLVSRYTKYGALAATKRAVQSAVMWQVIYNPLEAGPFGALSSPLSGLCWV